MWCSSNVAIIALLYCSRILMYIVDIGERSEEGEGENFTSQLTRGNRFITVLLLLY